MARKKLNLDQPIDVPVSGSGAPARTGGFIRAAQDTSPQRFRNTGAAMRERFRTLMAEAKDKASGLPPKDQSRVLDRPLDMGGVVPGRVDPLKVNAEVYQWSPDTPNARLNQKIKYHLKDTDYVANKAATGHYGALAKNEVSYRNGVPTISDYGRHLLEVHNGNHQAETDRLSKLVDQNDPDTIMEHAHAAGARILFDSTSITRGVPSPRLRVLASPDVVKKDGEAKPFRNDAKKPITARQDVDSLPKSARFEK